MLELYWDNGKENGNYNPGFRGGAEALLGLWAMCLWVVPVEKACWFYGHPTRVPVVIGKVIRGVDLTIKTDDILVSSRKCFTSQGALSPCLRAKAAGPAVSMTVMKFVISTVAAKRPGIKEPLVDMV